MVGLYQPRLVDDAMVVSFDLRIAVRQVPAKLANQVAELQQTSQLDDDPNYEFRLSPHVAQ